MSNVIAPIVDVLAATPPIPSLEAIHPVSLAAPSPSDLSNSVQSDSAALAIRVAWLRNEDQALSNVKDALNITAAAHAKTLSTSQILSRLKNLALQTTSTTLGVSERATLQVEFDALKTELARLADVAQSDNAATQTAAAVEMNRVTTDAIDQEAQASSDTLAAHNAQTTQDALATQATTDAATQAAANDATQQTNAATTSSNRTHDLIVEHTDESVRAQANQDAETALKLLQNG